MFVGSGVELFRALPPTLFPTSSSTGLSGIRKRTPLGQVSRKEGGGDNYLIFRLQ